MHLRIASASDTEVRIGFLELSDEIDRVVICPAAAVGLLQLGSQITPERHDVDDPRLFDLVDPFGNGFSVR